MSTQIKTFSGLEEIREILKIHDDAWNHSHGILDLLKNSSECFILFVDNANMAGYAFIEEDKERGFIELQDIAISSAYRGKGYGKLLMKKIMDKYSWIKLIARAQDLALISFYKYLGFSEDFLIENYYNIGEDGLRMSWSSDKK